MIAGAFPIDPGFKPGIGAYASPNGQSLGTLQAMVGGAGREGCISFCPATVLLKLDCWAQATAVGWEEEARWPKTLLGVHRLRRWRRFWSMVNIVSLLIGIFVGTTDTKGDFTVSGSSL
jgi:hypothetical protein